ncbi:hypothetical protein BH24ACT10_BH24ACT10_00910 [soil metagenome]
MTVLHDTGRTPAEQVRRDALLAQAVQVSADAIFCQDLHGTVTTWNAAAERIYGYPAAVIVGRRAEELMPDRTRTELRAAHRTALAGTRVERFDSWHERSDGTLVPVNVSAVPLLDDHGAVVAVATTIADVSERTALARDLEVARVRMQKQNAALTRSNRDLEQFAYVASHDLSEPLRVMTGYVERIEHRYDELLDDRGRRYMQHIVDASRRMRSLIDDLLDYSRFLRAPREPVEVDTRAVVDRVLRTLLPSMRESRTTVHVGALPRVWSDAAQLESLLSNLISNATKFHSPGREPHIEMSGSEHGGWVTLVVDDNGIGIDEEYRERVFRMFQRLHVREAYPGTGIGLAIAQQIVELHEGRIWIEESPLGGARFCCTLPAGPPQEDS